MRQSMARCIRALHIPVSALEPRSRFSGRMDLLHRQTMTTRNYIRTAALVATVALLIGAVGCEDVVTTPSQSRPPSAPPTSPPAGPVASGGSFPDLVRAGEIYGELGAPYGYPASLQYHDGILASRFVLYRDSTFGLQFSSGRFGFFEYRGSFVRTDSSITFNWEGWSTAGPWGATAKIRGDTLHVVYNAIMMLTDFVDADYLRRGPAP
jgi:hypothetical protein